MAAAWTVRRPQRVLLTVVALGLVAIAWPDVSGAPVIVAAEASGRANVTLFMTAWCRACQRLMRGLDRESIPYRAVDIEKDPKRYDPIRERLGKVTVPVTLIRRGGEERMIVGASSRQVVAAFRELSD